MDIMAGLTAISETLKITKEIRNIDAQIDKADLKLRLADLVDGLLEAKEALQDAREQERRLQDEIFSLTKKLQDRGRFEDERGCLYQLDDEGKRIGVPYCHYCSVKEEKLFRLKYERGSEYSSAGHWCDNCKTTHHD